MNCLECATKNVDVLPGFNSFKTGAPRDNSNPPWCQTCIRLRLERLEKLWKP